MEGKEYLDQISASVRPPKKNRAIGFLSSKIVKIIIGGVVAFVLIAIVGAVIRGVRPNIHEQIVALKYHIDNTLEKVDQYKTGLKSSDLRSNSASLVGVLSNTSRELEVYLEEKYNKGKLSNDSDLEEEAKLEADELEGDLFDAKINGTLDRIFARKMAYEISAIATKASRIREATSDEELGSILGTTYSSLENLYGKFNDFSKIK